MDRRLFLEFLPGIVFLFANAIWSLFAATAAAVLAAVIAVALRYRIDSQIPFLAIATVALSLVLLAIGYTLNDERFIKVKPTLGGLAFALILAIGYAFSPSLLERSLGYKLLITRFGWKLLHIGWISLAVFLALLNEAVWRNTTTDAWVAFNVVSGPVAFALYWLVTWSVAWHYWQED